MQRLELSCAVRHIRMSLGAKWLTSSCRSVLLSVYSPHVSAWLSLDGFAENHIEDFYEKLSGNSTYFFIRLNCRAVLRED